MATITKNGSSNPSFRLFTKDAQNDKTSVKAKVVADLSMQLEKKIEQDESFEQIATSLLDYMTEKIKIQYERDKSGFLEAIELFLVSSKPLTGAKDASQHKNGNQVDKESYMDDCLRLLILVKAMRKRQQSPLVMEISKRISQRWPVLAFMRQSNVDTTLFDCCTHGCMHTFTEDIDMPFHLSVKNGYNEHVKIMLDNLKIAFEEQSDELKYLTSNSILDVLRVRPPEISVLSLALNASKCKDDILKELLTVKGLALLNDFGTPDPAFDLVIKEGMDSVVDDFLENGVPVSENCLNDALELLAKAKSASSIDKASRTNVVRALMSKAPKVIDYKIVKYIIMNDLTSVWSAAFEEKLERTTKEYLLPTAVLYKSVDFIELFIKKNPGALSKDVKLPGYEGAPTAGNASQERKRYPLWYNNHELRNPEKNEYSFELRQSKSDDRHAKIRTLLVDKMIRELSINDLSDVLHHSMEPFRELCFDLSSFNSETHSVADYIEAIISQDEHESQKSMEFEHTLKYVAFPQLDIRPAERETYKDNTNLGKQHNEVFKVLKWLKDTKKVKTIMKLIIPDRLINPHDDVEMAKWLATFGVEHLEWKAVDLCFTKLRDAMNPETPAKEEEKTDRGGIKSLHLYSSGNLAVIEHWFSEDGIERLDDLEELYIYVVKETCTTEQAQKALSRIGDGIPNVRSKFEKKRKGTEKENQEPWIPDPDVKAWYPTPAVVDLNQITHHLSPRLGKLIENLDQQVKDRETKKTLTRTKVAILDNGILSIPPKANNHVGSGSSVEGKKKSGSSEGTDATSNPQVASDSATPAKPQAGDQASRINLRSRIMSGQSFVESTSRFSPWQFPSDAHGTQMANLICAMDPYCDLYVARVAESAFGISAASVVKAIDWAIGHEVDVISMSFAVDSNEDNEDLKTALKKALGKDIVMLCSSHDEGSRVSKAWPASLFKDGGEDYNKLIVTAACDDYGHLLRDVESTSYSYQLPGKDVRAGAVPFVKSTETISGSSVSTAIAAGISSLILTCVRLAHPQTKTAAKPKKWRHKTVVHYLDKMKASESTKKHVLLERFGNIGDAGVGKGHRYINPRMPSVEEFLEFFKQHYEEK